MDISFSTLGCPQWDLDTICREGARLGFDGVDFRGIQDAIDITLTPAFTRDLAQTRNRLADAGLQVSCISSSISICEQTKLQTNLEEARRTIPVALELGCGRVRVFGNGRLHDHTREELADMGRDTVEQILQLDAARQLRWIFETHDLWTSGRDTRIVLDRIPEPAFGALWDVGHTTRVGGETPEETYQQLGDRILYAHIKDAVYEPQHAQAMQDGWRYVQPGTGQLPLAKAITLLRTRQYDGWLMFEHEKRWHPELDGPEEIFPAFVDWIRPLIS